MKLFSANIKDLRTLYIDQLRKALDLEQKITRALPTMIEKTTDSELAEAFTNHLEETRSHVAIVESLLNDLIGEASTSTCKVIGALVSETEDAIEDVTDPAVRDVVLIGSAQQVEHHEIAVYGTLRNWAEILGLDDHATRLEVILEQEKTADKTLTAISDSVNTLAEADTPVHA